MEIFLEKPFDSLPIHTVSGKPGSEQKIKVGRKVFFCFEPEALLNPDGVLGKYKIQFNPELGDPFTVEPEPEKYYTMEEAIQRALKLLTNFNVWFHLQYRLFGEQPTSQIGFGSDPRVKDRA